MTLSALPQRLLSQARESLASPCTVTLADTLDGTVLVEQMAEGEELLEDLYVAFYLPPKPSGVLPAEWRAVVIAAFFPEADVADITYGPPIPRGPPPRGLDRGLPLGALALPGTARTRRRRALCHGQRQVAASGRGSGRDVARTRRMPEGNTR